MTHRRYLYPLLAVALLSIAAPAQARSISAGACSIKHVQLVRANAYVVVADVPRDSLGVRGFFPNERIMCDVAVGRWRRLARTDIDPTYDTLRISGHYVGFSGNAVACEDCNGDDSFVGVKNAATGHTVFMRYMHLTESDDTKGYSIPDMTLKPNGSVAFTVVGNWRHSWRNSRLVIKHDLCGGTQVVDKSKRDLRVRSLRRQGAQIRWRVAGVRRSVKFC